jgi:phage repressor protein C with HTH and peptisase S24 domain
MHQRLKAARVAASFRTATEASSAFGWKLSTYRAHENGQNQFDTKTALIYSQAFKVSAAWLLTGEKQLVDNTSLEIDAITSNINFKPTKENTIFILSSVGDGFWIEDFIVEENKDTQTSPLPPDLRFPLSEQFDLIAKGNSNESKIYNGELIRCLKIQRDVSHIKENEIVVVKLTRGEMKGYVLRRLEIIQNTIKLVPLNLNDANYKTLDYTQGSKSVEIIGKALYKFSIL